MTWDAVLRHVVATGEEAEVLHCLLPEALRLKSAGGGSVRISPHFSAADARALIERSAQLAVAVVQSTTDEDLLQYAAEVALTRGWRGVLRELAERAGAPPERLARIIDWAVRKIDVDTLAVVAKAHPTPWCAQQLLAALPRLPKAAEVLDPLLIALHDSALVRARFAQGVAPVPLTLLRSVNDEPGWGDLTVEDLRAQWPRSASTWECEFTLASGCIKLTGPLVRVLRAARVSLSWQWMEVTREAVQEVCRKPTAADVDALLKCPGIEAYLDILVPCVVEQGYEPAAVVLISSKWELSSAWQEKLVAAVKLEAVDWEQVFYQRHLDRGQALAILSQLKRPTLWSQWLYGTSATHPEPGQLATLAQRCDRAEFAALVTECRDRVRFGWPWQVRDEIPVWYPELLELLGPTALPGLQGAPRAMLVAYLGEQVVHLLGTDPKDWEQVDELLVSWHGSVAELLTAVGALRS